MPVFKYQQSEAQFQSAIIHLARLCGWWIYHPWDSNHSERGWPDLVIVGYGRIYYRELKAGTRKLTQSQAAVLDLINANGGDAKVWRPTDWPEIEALLKRETPAVARKRVRDAERAGAAAAAGAVIR